MLRAEARHEQVKLNYMTHFIAYLERTLNKQMPSLRQ